MSRGLFGLLCLVAASPVILSLARSPVGGYRMFTEPVRYRLLVLAESEGRPPARVTLASLSPHMSRDARRVLGRADGFVVGETHVELLEGGLRDLGELVCRVQPAASAARITLHRERLSGEQVAPAEARVPCAP